jgi:hypothetical protein
MSQSSRHISVVSVGELERAAIKILCESPLVTSVAVAPTHFGELLSDGSINFDKRSKNLETIGSELIFNSLQGIFYALDAGDESINLSITNRIKSIAKICREFDISKIVVGAPNFRQHKLVWNFMMSELKDHIAEDGLQVLVENLCIPGQSNIHDAYGFSSLSDYGFGYVLDISNAMACDFHKEKEWLSLKEFDMVHASGPLHKEVYDAAEALELKKFLNVLGGAPEIIWEFNYGSVPEILNALRRTIDQITSDIC